MKYILNSVPASALIGKSGRFRPVTSDEALSFIADGGWVSAVGHDSTAQALSAWAGRTIPYNRISISLSHGDVLLVAALRGGRLAEGQVLGIEEINTRGFDFLLVEVEATENV